MFCALIMPFGFYQFLHFRGLCKMYESGITLATLAILEGLYIVSAILEGYCNIVTVVAVVLMICILT